MNSVKKRRFLRYGFLWHRKQLWLSELLSIAVLCIFLGSLGMVTATIFLNSRRIENNALTVSRLKNHRMSLENTLTDLSEKHSIMQAAHAVVGNRVSDSTLFHIVDLVYHNSKTYGYDPLLVLSVIYVESRFDSRALGRYRSGQLSGAFGLMQLKLETAREVARDLDIQVNSRDDLFKPEINLVLGIGYLTRMISRFRSFKLGLLAYNQGPGTIERTLKSKRELYIKYYTLVLDSYYRLKEQTQTHTPEAS